MEHPTQDEQIELGRYGLANWIGPVADFEAQFGKAVPQPFGTRVCQAPSGQPLRFHTVWGVYHPAKVDRNDTTAGRIEYIDNKSNEVVATYKGSLDKGGCGYGFGEERWHNGMQPVGYWCHGVLRNGFLKLKGSVKVPSIGEIERETKFDELGKNVRFALRANLARNTIYCGELDTRGQPDGSGMMFKQKDVDTCAAIIDSKTPSKAADDGNLLASGQWRGGNFISGKLYFADFYLDVATDKRRYWTFSAKRVDGLRFSGRCQNNFAEGAWSSDGAASPACMTFVSGEFVCGTGRKRSRVEGFDPSPVARRAPPAKKISPVPKPTKSSGTLSPADLEAIRDIFRQELARWGAATTTQGAQRAPHQTEL